MKKQYSNIELKSIIKEFKRLWKLFRKKDVNDTIYKKTGGK